MAQACQRWRAGCCRSLRIAIANDDDARPESIHVVEINDDGDSTNTFLIPLPSQVAIGSFGGMNEPPANIEPVSAEPIDHEEDGTEKTGSDDE